MMQDDYTMCRLPILTTCKDFSFLNSFFYELRCLAITLPYAKRTLSRFHLVPKLMLWNIKN